MAHLKEPKGDDFLIQSSTLTDDEEKKLVNSLENQNQKE